MQAILTMMRERLYPVILHCSKGDKMKKQTIKRLSQTDKIDNQKEYYTVNSLTSSNRKKWGLIRISQMLAEYLYANNITVWYRKIRGGNG